MKTKVALIFSVFLLTCQSDKHIQPETFNEDLSNTDLYRSNANGQSSDDENYQAGLDFLNAYIENLNSLEILEYVKTSPLATENLKTALENILIKAWEEDPELGLEFGPLFDAQDYPPKGVEMVDFNKETGYLTVKGLNGMFFEW